MSAASPIALQMLANGNIGNRMFQYVWLRRLQQHLLNSEIFGADILDFVPKSDSFAGSGTSIHIDGGHFYPFDTMAKLIVQNGIRCLRFGGYVQRLEYLGDVEDVRGMFSLPQPSDDARFQLLTSDRYITCVVRANEILRAIHPDYPPTPVSFFRAAVEESGRIPVLMGQTSSNFYADAIREMFPDCIVYDHVSPLEDFRFITHSTNVAIAVSTFAWMAAYLSRKARRIYLPMFGILNPKQRPDLQLLPQDDARYRFAEFEPMRWTRDDSQTAYVLDPRLPVTFTT